MEKYLNKENRNGLEEQTARGILGKIAGRTIETDFGKPFLEGFRALRNDGREEEMEVAAYVCSLYLSCAFTEFPTEKMHLFIHNTRDSYCRFSFDCRTYEKLYGMMPKEPFRLLGNDGRPVVRDCSKQEIFEAFDFFTNH